MSEWMTALVAAAAALGGSAVTGYFAVLAARRQADAAREAGQRQADAAWASAQRQADAAWASALRQADAQLEVMRQTLRDQADAAQREVRRAAYVAFLDRADQARQADVAWTAAPASAALREARDATLRAVNEALNVVNLEGPDDVAAAAEVMAVALANPAQQSCPAAHAGFIARARTALHPGQ